MSQLLNIDFELDFKTLNIKYAHAKNPYAITEYKKKQCFFIVLLFLQVTHARFKKYVEAEN